MKNSYGQARKCPNNRVNLQKHKPEVQGLINSTTSLYMLPTYY